MFSDTLISPKADFNIRQKMKLLGGKKKTHGSPDFRDILKQRCRERVKARRGALFDQLRSLNDEDSVRTALSQFIENDLQELQSSCSITQLSSSAGIDSMETCIDEPLSSLALSDKEKWILEEYERMIEDIDAQAELEHRVGCPMCGVGVLAENLTTIGCESCPLRLSRTMPLAQLQTSITQAVDSHGQSCQDTPQFTVLPEADLPGLMMICCSCGNMFQII